MLQANKKPSSMSTIDKTLLAANLIDGFWDRWIAHGVLKEDLKTIRSSYLTLERWMNGWRELADQKFLEAEKLKQMNFHKEAEMMLRTSSLYYQLIQWLIPNRQKEKIEWLNVSLSVFEQADKISNVETKYVQLPIENNKCFGRIRIPSNPRGVIVIINPLDSTKEELFTYETDFVNNDFVTVSFDGPGQGQTYTNQGFLGTLNRWKSFINKLIDFTFAHFPQLPIHLFGTSSGASWAIYGSCNPKVSKVVAVSPAFLNEEIRLPDYFIERTKYVLDNRESHILPSFEGLLYRNPIFLVHGKRDVMVSNHNVYNLYKQLPSGKCFKEYEEEGHCCNYKLPEIREITMNWLLKGSDTYDA
ncbi:serine aminopeptidase domain-containing protein [Peribacillus tepidiphilus]|uniref:serine aminopeptidase domain-containing protein n=1 Tax=Peribacillus tepidiphilus TaxID=2652445 RepID=UPI0035B4FDA7